MNDPTTDDPVLRDAEIYGAIETEAQDLAYGAMVFTVQPGCATAPHHHASEETWIVQEGDGRALIDGRSIGLITGTHLSVPSGAVHSITNTSTTDLRVMAFWWRRVSRDG